MAYFTSIEREMIEAAFGMGGGYVLDFTNRTFAEFIDEHLGFDPYNKQEYRGLSKAKILRAILQEQNDSFAGKIILKLIEYREFKDISNSGDKYIKRLTELGSSKLGRTASKPKKAKPSEQCTDAPAFNAKRHLANLLSIDQPQNTPQQKGYAFERFLHDLFQAYDLSPRVSYRTEYDQIDGSLVLDSNTVLLEAKYRSSSPTKDDLILFSNKIATKSQFVRGLFVCQERIPDHVVEYFKLREGKTVVAMTVEEIYMILSEGHDFLQVLRKKFRALDETGIIFRYFRELV